MKDDGLFQDNVSKETIDKIDAALQANAINFNELTSILGLNPLSDFRYADLSDVDLTSSDLRQHDFTGANLRGAVGIEVTWDATTNLRDADTTNSVFSYSERQAKFFDEHPELEREFSILRRGFWQDQILDVAERLNKRPDDTSQMLARRLFTVSQDKVVKSNIMYILQHKFVDTDANFEFLMDVIARGNSDDKTISFVIRLLADIFYNYKPAAGLFVHYIQSPNRELRLHAYRGIFRSRYLSEYWQILIETIATEKDEEVRRRFVEYTVKKKRPFAKMAALEPFTKKYLDFMEPITADKVRLIAVTLARLNKPVSFEANKLDIEHQIAFVTDSIRDLKKIGIPFAIEQD